MTPYLTTAQNIKEHFKRLGGHGSGHVNKADGRKEQRNLEHFREQRSGLGSEIRQPVKTGHER